jgi:hypothetical protein
MSSDRSGISRGDRIAITVGCLAGAEIVIVYLVPTKSALSTVVMLIFLLGFLCYPIIHFVRSKKIKVPFILLVCVLVFLFGKKEWPTPHPVSDLRIVKEIALPFNAGQPPELNIWLLNDSPYTMRVRRIVVAGVLTGATSQSAERETESTLWQGLRDNFEMLQKNVFPADDSSPDIYSNYLPPRVESTITLNVESTTSNLTADQANALQHVDGSVVVFFMAIFAYSDDSGFHEIEYCVWTQGRNMLRCSTGHNGPVRSSRSRWWN